MTLSPSTPPTQSGMSGRTRVPTPRAPRTSATPSQRNLSSLLRLQNVEDSKPRLSKLSWMDDVLVYQSSIIPIVAGPVVMLTLFAGGVALASIVFGKQVALTNNVVPLLSVVVGLLLVFRNSTAYERYAEGRKDFTALISNARNLTRSIWINVVPPPTGEYDRAELTRRKKELIRLVVGFVFATKHYLRSEGGVHHADMKGLLPRSLHEFARRSTEEVYDSDVEEQDEGLSTFGGSTCASPKSYSSPLDEEQGLPEEISQPIVERADWRPAKRPGVPARRPTAVRVRRPENLRPSPSSRSLSERTPLLKSGVRTDVRRTYADVDAITHSSMDCPLGSMVEVGLPLVIAHEIGRSLFRFRRQGCIDVVGPAGFNAMQGLVQTMTDQLGSMERIIQTPLPYVFCVHLKQCVTLYLLCLPFVLVETMGWKMIPVVMCTAFTLCGVEGIAAQIEQPFGTDPCDLNLDLFCTELLCECEAVIERLPQGDEDNDIIYQRTFEEIRRDEEDGE